MAATNSSIRSRYARYHPPRLPQSFPIQSHPKSQEGWTSILNILSNLGKFLRNIFASWWQGRSVKKVETDSLTQKYLLKLKKTTHSPVPKEPIYNDPRKEKQRLERLKKATYASSISLKEFEMKKLVMDYLGDSSDRNVLIEFPFIFCADIREDQLPPSVSLGFALPDSELVRFPSQKHRIFKQKLDEFKRNFQLQLQVKDEHAKKEMLKYFLPYKEDATAEDIVDNFVMDLLLDQLPSEDISAHIESSHLYTHARLIQTVSHSWVTSSFEDSLKEEIFKKTLDLLFGNFDAIIEEDLEKWLKFVRECLIKIPYTFRKSFEAWEKQKYNIEDFERVLKEILKQKRNEIPRLLQQVDEAISKLVQYRIRHQQTISG